MGVPAIVIITALVMDGVREIVVIQIVEHCRHLVVLLAERHSSAVV